LQPRQPRGPAGEEMSGDNWIVPFSPQKLSLHIMRPLVITSTRAVSPHTQRKSDKGAIEKNEEKSLNSTSTFINGLNIQDGMV
jgi:hypothetical protein